MKIAEGAVKKAHAAIRETDMSKKEDELNLLFADKIMQSVEFASWVLSKTKFRGVASRVRLLHEEQAVRPAKFWWKHWWSHVPALMRDSETDIFLVFEAIEAKMRFALHIETNWATAAFKMASLNLTQFGRST